MTDLVLKGHTIEFVGTLQELWTKGSGDELGVVSETANHG